MKSIQEMRPPIDRVSTREELRQVLDLLLECEPEAATYGPILDGDWNADSGDSDGDVVSLTEIVLGRREQIN